MRSLPHMIHRLRYGAPVIVVSGLPRSGTSMAMRMLQAGGVPILADDRRVADEGNPHGYFEFEPVKQLDKSHGDVSWLPKARGNAVKIISFLLTGRHSGRDRSNPSRDMTAYPTGLPQGKFLFR